MNPHPSAPGDELAVIGACLLSDIAIEDTANLIEPSDFHIAKHGAIYATILDLHQQGIRVDPFAVHRELAAGWDVTVTELHQLMLDAPVISNADRYATAVADAKVRRDLIHAADQITQLATGQQTTFDAADAADRARRILADIDMPAGRGAPDPDIDTFIHGTDNTYNWLIPGVLEHGDRMLVTSAEGMGKSMLLRQIGVQVAAGIHPWTYQPTTPHNVLIIDLENGPRLVSRSLDRLRTTAANNLDPQRCRIHTRPAGVNLLSRTGRRWLIDRCQANNAELLVIGPLYRMWQQSSDRSEGGGEQQAIAVTQALDEVRARAGVTLLMETHAPHGNSTGHRDLRPIGSSAWLRWPEFGIGFAATDSARPNEYRLSHWRGPRDVRIWPRLLQRAAGRWPWTPVLPDNIPNLPTTTQPELLQAPVAGG